MRITSPPGQKVFDLFLTVESRPSILAKIAMILGESNIDILAGGIECSDDKKTGYDLFYLEMANAKVTPEELVKTLKAQELRHGSGNRAPSLGSGLGTIMLRDRWYRSLDPSVWRPRLILGERSAKKVGRPGFEPRRRL